MHTLVNNTISKQSQRRTQGLGNINIICIFMPWNKADLGATNNVDGRIVEFFIIITLTRPKREALKSGAGTWWHMDLSRMPGKGNPGPAVSRSVQHHIVPHHTMITQQPVAPVPCIIHEWTMIRSIWTGCQAGPTSCSLLVGKFELAANKRPQLRDLWWLF